MIEVWDPANKVRMERRLWVAVLEAQRDLGIEVDAGLVDDYRSVMDQVDPDSIVVERGSSVMTSRRGSRSSTPWPGTSRSTSEMTSRDLTENVEQAQILRSLDLIITRSVASRPPWHAWPQTGPAWR